MTLNTKSCALNTQPSALTRTRGPNTDPAFFTGLSSGENAEEKNAVILAGSQKEQKRIGQEVGGSEFWSLFYHCVILGKTLLTVLLASCI